ncbi:hypothetical protein C8J56DRAFT_392946 [Mycena floridula]|nr:hypothetical protein C8J56DRAFT_392946 [Mycena floridula]
MMVFFHLVSSRSSPTHHQAGLRSSTIYYSFHQLLYFSSTMRLTSVASFLSCALAVASLPTLESRGASQCRIGTDHGAPMAACKKDECSKHTKCEFDSTINLCKFSKDVVTVRNELKKSSQDSPCYNCKCVTNGRRGLTEEEKKAKTEKTAANTARRVEKAKQDRKEAKEAREKQRKATEANYPELARANGKKPKYKSPYTKADQKRTADERLAAKKIESDKRRKEERDARDARQPVRVERKTLQPIMPKPESSRATGFRSTAEESGGSSRA